MKRVLQSSLLSAILGGVIVGAVFTLAIAAGWIEGEDGSTTTVAAPAAAPIAVSDGGDEENSNPVNEIYRRAGDGVASIKAELGAEGAPVPSPFGAPEGEGEGAATGSGFLIDRDGHVITNSHVVEGAERVEVTLGSSDEAYEAEVVGSDPATDVALLEIDAPADQLKPLSLGDSDRVQVGEPVVAIGNPFGLERTVTAGIVSALQRQIQAPNGFSISHVLQTDAPINPGNSGGPLIDSGGQVIGINTQIQTGGSQGNVGIGFAVPINMAREVVEQLKESGEVQHAYIGISGGTITPDLAEALELPVDQGVLIDEVVEGGPADEAGLEGGDTSATIEGATIQLGGDIITEVDGRPIEGMEDVIDAVNSASPGDELRLTVRRGDKSKDVTVELGVRPESAEDTQSGPVGPPAR
ncbi:MAG TPA: trypsin-like peptidase domain-containing protein [Solirubrobacterales bacterium]|nr:trypsin-like peptidase domain-containing protein [Solirubrobacterales bacterium]